MARTVAILIYPGVNLLDVSGPAQVFSSASALVSARGQNDVASNEGYDVILIGSSRGIVQTDSGIELNARYSVDELDRLAIDTLLVPGGVGVFAQSTNGKIQRLLRNMGSTIRRLASVCTGAFVLAEAGLLEGKRATTHWDFCENFRQRYPEVTVDPNAIYTCDENVWTSAGVTAGIDLALAMVSHDFGHQIALNTAKRLVVFLKRPSGQAQCSATLLLQLADGAGKFDDLNAWISDNLEKDLSVESLAKRVHMSPRTFARHYTAATRRTPAKAVELIRIEAARRMLESKSMPIGVVAAKCGFGTWERMRRALSRGLEASAAGMDMREVQKLFDINRGLEAQAELDVYTLSGSRRVGNDL